ncbi:MAG: response regulator [Pseudomonadales bacterium]|nr:response regulator [Pseudomonadales bacterium]
MARVLVVDDSSFLAEKIKGYMESKGHEIVGIAEDGVQGLQSYMQHKPDLVTLDLTMPNKDGHDCLMDILSFDANAKAVIVSAIDDKKLIMDCLKLGAKGFVEKPLKFKNAEFCTVFDSAINDALH